MAKRQLSNYRTDIRAITDLDSTDLPDATLDMFLRDGARYAQRFNQGLWPFFEELWTFDTVDEQAAYDMDTEVAEDHASDYLVAQIRTVRRDDLTLIPWNRDTYERTVRVDATTEGKPSYWTLWGENLTLYPVPDGIYTLTVRGWRKGMNWIGDGTTATVVSDMPEEFDDAILQWALGDTYAHQDEPATSLYYHNRADLTLTQLEDQYDQSIPTDIVMNRGSAGGRMGPRPMEEAPFWWEALN